MPRARRRPERRAERPALLLAGRPVPVIMTRHSRARRIRLRVDPATHEVRITLPVWASHAEGLAFARDEAAWIGRALARLPARTAFEDGAIVPYLGRGMSLRHYEGSRGTVWVEGDEIYVAGDARHMARRLSDWLKTRARAVVTARVRDHADRLGVRPARITLRDTRTRWGSCSSTGTLSFSWRLVMCPEPVIDYVAAHEVAHLVHPNHSTRFWRLVRELVPDYAAHERWLDAEGSRLHLYG